MNRCSRRAEIKHDCWSVANVETGELETHLANKRPYLAKKRQKRRKLNSVGEFLFIHRSGQKHKGFPQDHNIQVVLASHRGRGMASVSIVGGTMLQSSIAIDSFPPGP